MSSRWTWRFLALPGVAWLSVFFLLALYVVVAVASLVIERRDAVIELEIVVDHAVGVEAALDRGAHERPVQ